MNFEFGTPIWFAALGAVFALALWLPRRRHGRVRMASLEGYGRAAKRSGGWKTAVPLLLRLLALALLIVALARPREGLERARQRDEGIDIVLTIDVSTSMRAEDFTLQGKRVNRLEVVKAVVRDFIERRENDRLSIVVFAGRPYIQSPLTLDHTWLIDQLNALTIGMIEDGTAIGEAIGASINRLRDSEAKSKVIVLLTDGLNNAGTLTPEAGAELADALGIRIYAIGAGTKGMAPYPTRDLFGRPVYQQVKLEVDDDGLTALAERTGGRYFRATDTDSLKETYETIDKLERTTFEQPHYRVYRELYVPWVFAALGCVLLEIVLGRTLLRVLP